MRHLLCLSLLLLPVAAAPDEKPESDPRRVKPGDAPTPYTADEIRKACPAGLANVFRAESRGQVVLRTQKFLKCDEKGAEIEFVMSKEDGTEARSQTKFLTWKELQSHASFPEAETKITEETIEVPAGKFDCWLYAVTQNAAGKQVKRSFHFAKNLPGPPVKMVVEVDGKVDSTMTLLEHKEPAAEGKPADEKPAEGEKPAGG